MNLGPLRQTTGGHHSERVGKPVIVHEAPEFLSRDEGGFVFAYFLHTGHSRAHTLECHLAQNLALPAKGEQPLPPVAVDTDDFHQPADQCQCVRSPLTLAQQRSSGQVGLVRVSRRLRPLLVGHQSTKRRQREAIIFAHAITVEKEPFW